MSHSSCLTIPSLVPFPLLLGVRLVPGTVFARFEQQACRTPEQIALFDLVTDTRLSYGQLRRRAAHLAQKLAEQGCNDGTVVGLCLERSPEAIIAMLAILKQGAAYLPLDPAWPAARMRLVLTLAQARLVITHAALRETFLALPNVEVLVPDRLDQPSAFFVGTTLIREDDHRGQIMSDDALACMLPIASTAKSYKVVGLSQRSLLRHAHLHDCLVIHPTDRVAQVMPLFSVPAHWEVWATLLSGATPASLLHAPLALARAVQTHHITTLFVPTTLFHRIVKMAPSTFADLDTLLVGGETVATHLVQRLWQHGPPRRLVQVYGQAETGGIRLVSEVSDPTTITAATLPLGEPVNATSVVIVDEKGQQIEQAGQTGELVLSGKGLDLCYPGYPDLTAANPCRLSGAERSSSETTLARSIAARVGETVAACLSLATHACASLCLRNTASLGDRTP